MASWGCNRAIDKHGNTFDWMLSRHRNKQAAKKFLKKNLGNAHVVMPNVINVDKNPAFLPAQLELLKEGEFRTSVRLRQIKYLNNAIENDHKPIKRKSRYRQWVQSFFTANSAIDGMETMRLIQKGQIRYAPKGNIFSRNRFIHKIFGLAL